MNEKVQTPSIRGIMCKDDCSLLLEKDSIIMSVPLLKFGLELATVFEEKLTSTALCFIADASSGLGTKMLGEIVSSCGAELVFIEEPTWMTTLAYAIQQKKIQPSQIPKILFALARLDAWRVRNDVRESRTVVFTLPGQACTAPLLSSLQEAFPHERHVFVYNGCIDSVSRGLRLRNHSSVDCIPIVPLPNATVQKYDVLLKKLPWDRAGIVEAWMSSVDAFLKLKHKERKTGYMPFVCRLGFLMSQFGKLGNGTKDQSEVALMNVLQYITGSRSRKLKEEVIIAAKKTLTNLRDAELKEIEKNDRNLSEFEKGVIEECAFAHKEILIENKTLMDTVQPKTEWSLKATKKLTSCACCMPGQGDEDEDEDEENYDVQIKDDNGGEEKEKKVAKTSSTATPSGGYVDGKTMFAFDPSKFTGM